MLESITTGGLTIQSLLICSGVALAMGLVVALVHRKTAKSTKNFAVALVTLPLLVQGVMMMVNGNLGTGVALLGAFSLVRFRSIPGTSREIVSVFFAMSIGLATGTGYVGFALLSTAMIAPLLVLLHYLRFFDSTNPSKLLRITIPENTNPTDAFTDVFAKNGVEATLEQIKTKNMGSLYEVTYAATLPSSLDPKAFMDELRVRNANLPIALYEQQLEGGL